MRIHQRHHLVIEALANGATQTAAAKVVGAARRTVVKWLHDADFLAALREREAEVLVERRTACSRLFDLAVCHLEEALKEGGKPAMAAARIAMSPHIMSFSLGAGGPGTVEMERQHPSGQERVEIVIVDPVERAEPLPP